MTTNRPRYVRFLFVRPGDEKPGDRPVLTLDAIDRIRQWYDDAAMVDNAAAREAWQLGGPLAGRNLLIGRHVPDKNSWEPATPVDPALIEDQIRMLALDNVVVEEVARRFMSLPDEIKTLLKK